MPNPKTESDSKVSREKVVFRFAPGGPGGNKRCAPARSQSPPSQSQMATLLTMGIPRSGAKVRSKTRPATEHAIVRRVRIVIRDFGQTPNENKISHPAL